MPWSTITGPLFEVPNPCASSWTDDRGPRTKPPAPSVRRASAAPARKAPRFCALLFGELAMLGSSLCESRKAVLGPRAGGSPSMELTAAHRESGGTLAWRAPARSGLAPLTLPVWAVKPWFGIGFHCAQLSSVYGVLLYPIWMALLGMRDLVHGPRPEQN